MINNHKDLNKPYYVAKNAENIVFHYGKITEGQVLSTSMPIKAYVHKQSMINFIERNGGEYIDLEL
jgi:ribosomal protein L18E